MIINFFDGLSLKQCLYSLLFIFICVVSVGYYTTYNKVKKLETEKENAVLNYKAVVGTNRVLNLNIDDLEDSNDRRDSLVNKLKDSLKMKNKNIILSLYIHDTIYSENTIYLTDTFLVKGKDIDTIIGDKWLSNRLLLSYPNKIALKTKVDNEKVVLINRKRETINKPFKFWVFRLFQKKRDYLMIDISNTNPYLNNFDNKTIYYTIK